MIDELLADAEDRMQGAVAHLVEELATIRTGRASPALVEKLEVIYYDTPTPLNQLASISVPEARTLQIKPYDATSMKDIERAIYASDLGLTPNNDGHIIRLFLPPLNEERRRDLLKVVSQRVEDARIAIRNVRRDVISEMREYEKEKLISEDDLSRGEKNVQTLTDKYIGELNDLGQKKEEEVMTV